MKFWDDRSWLSDLSQHAFYFAWFCCSSSLSTFFNKRCLLLRICFEIWSTISQSSGTTAGEVPDPESTQFGKYLGEHASGLFSHGNLEMLLLPPLYSKVKMGYLVLGCILHRGRKPVKWDPTSRVWSCMILPNALPSVARWAVQKTEGKPACIHMLYWL